MSRRMPRWLQGSLELSAGILAVIASSVVAQNTTLQGCICRTNWTNTATNTTCLTGCCNPDNDPKGKWCVTESPCPVYLDYCGGPMVQMIGLLGFAVGFVMYAFGFLNLVLPCAVHFKKPIQDLCPGIDDKTRLQLDGSISIYIPIHGNIHLSIYISISIRRRRIIYTYIYIHIYI